ncbi:very long chain fatty acid elongase AAEL008004-like [Rhynchophorus ferrugineus]|uniref:Elongation of very long chain fatty acids protein n=1 Tax=Rhynchophorus ferrugineus TaxID=354439 RepID=A0A834I150_RHYFE|nr:hypothetical protein GWI33_016781 [Rhynchophorus ferrugineus]
MDAFRNIFDNEQKFWLNISQYPNTTVKDIPFLARVLAERYTDVYHYTLDQMGDPRTANWPLMESPIPTVLMVLTYLYVILWMGPRMMANRKPFKLKNVLIIYNGAQVLLSLYMMYEHLASGWLWDYSYKCQPVDYSTSAKAMRMVRLCYVYYFSKLTEFVDTIFFVLRKKDSQVSFLHVYHHSLTPLETWFLVRFIAGGHGTFSNLINNFVHVILYFYYMVAAMGPEYHKYLWWKIHLTHAQLIQFVLVFVHSAQLLWTDCGYPQFMGALLLVHSTIFFILFSNFYYQTFIKPKKPTKPTLKTE